MCFSPQRRAIFRQRNFKKCSETVNFWAFWLDNVFLATAACNFWFLLLTTWLRTRRFNEPTFRLTWHANHWKNLAARDFSNIWRGLSFFLLTFALLHLRSPDFISFHLFFICFSTLHILGSLLFKFLWIIGRQLRTCFLHMHSLSFSILSLDRTVLGFNSPTPQVPVGRTCQQQPLCVLFRCIRCYSGRLKFHFLGLWGLVGSQYIPRSYVLFSG